MTDLIRRLSLRERVLVLCAVLFIGGSLIYGLVVNPLISSQRKYQALAARQRENLDRFRELAVQYRETEASLASLEKAVSGRRSETSLLAAMEGEARKLGLADRITSMKPFSNELDSGMVESSVEVKIEKIDLKELTEFLKTVEKNDLMAKISRLRVKSRFDDRQILDVTVLITALESR
jgi:type II secretory pathway component PulM